ncbi:MAG TPA: hypothetical protein VLE91_01350 [Candidatus Saccharimonadales bacterium]|nr:hypothetical protein [Candidatus Saccharimonadales bacterium]
MACETSSGGNEIIEKSASATRLSSLEGTIDLSPGRQLSRFLNYPGVRPVRLVPEPQELPLTNPTQLV